MSELEKYGIKETKELIKFVIDLNKALGLSLIDGKLGLVDAVHFIGAISSAGAAFDNISKVPKEFSDLSPQEIDELFKYVIDEFDIDNKKVEKIIKKSIETVQKIFELFTIFRT